MLICSGILKTDRAVGFKLLPLYSGGLIKRACIYMGYTVGERNVLTFHINQIELKFNIYYADQISHLQLHYIQRGTAEASKEENYPHWCSAR